MNDHAGFVDVGPARRLANTISTMKIVLIGLSGVGTIAGMAAAEGGIAIVSLIYGSSRLPPST